MNEFNLSEKVKELESELESVDEENQVDHKLDKQAHYFSMIENRLS